MMTDFISQFDWARGCPHSQFRLFLGTSTLRKCFESILKLNSDPGEETALVLWLNRTPESIRHIEQKLWQRRLEC